MGEIATPVQTWTSNKKQISAFQQAAGLSFTDSFANELDASAEAMREMMEGQLLWGCSTDVGFTGDAIQYSGIYPWILSDAPTTNVIDGSNATVALTNLDAALDLTKNKYQNLKGGKWVFLMSPAMRHKVSALQTLIRRQVNQLTFEGSFMMDTYEDVPILPSGFIAPSATGASVSGLAGTASGSGAYTGTYRYKVAAITRYGEQVASATAAVSATSATTVDLSWTYSATALSYAIYRTALDEADTAALYDLIDIIPAQSYSSGLGSSDTTPTYADVLASTSQRTAVHPLAATDEAIFLVYLDQNHGAALSVLPPVLGDNYGGDALKNLVRYHALTENTSSFQFRLESYQALQIPDATTCVALRRFKSS